MTTRITNSVHLTQVEALVDKMMGFPKDPTYRGARCPPIPFGRTQRYAVRNTNGGVEEYHLITPAEIELDAGAPGLSVAERAQLNVIRAAGEVLAAQAAKEART